MATEKRLRYRPLCLAASPPLVSWIVFGGGEGQADGIIVGGGGVDDVKC